MTNSSEETELNRVLSGDQVFNIPYFQRAYKWMPERLHKLEEDLLQVVDAEDSHFLGAVIIYLRPPSNTADPMVYDVIDGQQRITTLFLYICAVVRTLCRNKLYDDALAGFQKYLVINRDTKLPSNSRLHCGKDNRAQLNRVFAELLSDTVLANRLTPFKFKPLPSSGNAGGRLWNNYRAAVRFLEQQVQAEGIGRLQELYSALTGALTVVQIVVRNPTDGPKIFDSLNSRQEPMTTGDLVRNEIFSRVADYSPEKIEEIDQRSWQPFYGKFHVKEKSLFDDFFFPFGLIADPNLKKSEVYGKLRESWKPIDDPEQIIASLADYQNAFLDMARGTNTQELSATVASGFAHLHEASAPSSTYPFLMQLSNAVRDKIVDEATAASVLSVIESFLIRRAISGHEPTGLHAVFKRLWVDCHKSPTAISVEAAIRKHRTVVWPSDQDVRSAITTRPPGPATVRYLLLAWNRHLKGDQPTATPWIEHVLPQSPEKSWFDVFTSEQHREMVDLFANLLPLSKEMNQALSNGPYEKKRSEYADHSGFGAAREFASRYPVWTPEALKERSQKLADWAVEEWPH